MFSNVFQLITDRGSSNSSTVNKVDITTSWHSCCTRIYTWWFRSICWKMLYQSRLNLSIISIIYFAIKYFFYWNVNWITNYTLDYNTSEKYQAYKYCFCVVSINTIIREELLAFQWIWTIPKFYAFLYP